MVDISHTIVPKSDQLNADDLIAEPRTIHITRVEVKKDPKQPVWIFFDGDEGKPWKPCLGMRRVIIKFWGKESDNYIGKSVTLIRDDSVEYGGAEVGGIRIFGMSHIDGPQAAIVTLKRGRRKLLTVQPIKAAPQKQTKPAKKPGNIESARVALASADSGTIAEIRKGLLAWTWTAEEGAEIKRLVTEAEERKA